MGRLLVGSQGGDPGISSQGLPLREIKPLTCCLNDELSHHIEAQGPELKYESSAWICMRAMDCVVAGGRQYFVNGRLVLRTRGLMAIVDFSAPTGGETRSQQRSYQVKSGLNTA